MQHLISLSRLIMILWKPGCNLSPSLTYSFHIVVLLPHAFWLNFLFLKGSMCLSAAFHGENTAMSHLFWGSKKRMHGALWRLDYLMKGAASLNPCWSRHPCHKFFFFSFLTWFLEASPYTDYGIKSKKKLNVSDYGSLFLEKKQSLS